MIKKVIFDCVTKLSEYAEEKYSEYSIRIKRKKDNKSIEIMLDVSIEGGVNCSVIDIHESEFYLAKYPEIVIEESTDILIRNLEKDIERYVEK
jgi:hypothetical protein